MTNTVQDKVKSDFEKAQQEGGQRLARIRDIVKAAATEAFSELKDGSTEIESLSRKSLADMIAQIKTQEAAEAAIIETTETTTVVVEGQVAPPLELSLEGGESVGESGNTAEATAKAPTWQELFADVLNLANERKADWAEQFLVRLQTQMERFDTDMVAEYGGRYRLVQPAVWGLRRLVDLAHRRVAKPSASEPATPVTIEVLDN